MKKKNSGNHIGFGADIFCDGRSSGICRRQAVGKTVWRQMVWKMIFRKTRQK